MIHGAVCVLKFTYGSEMWKLNRAQRRRIQVSEIKTLRGIARLKFEDRVPKQRNKEKTSSKI